MITPLSLNGAMSAKACLDDFLSRVGMSVEILARFTNIQAKTVKSWGRDISPGGERWIQVNYLLSLVGYTVAEFEQISPLLQQAAAYISLGIVTPAEAATRIGASDPKRMFEYIRGNNGISAERAEKLQALLSEKAAAFEKKKAAVLSELEEARKIVCKDKLTPEALIEKFEAACTEVRALGHILLDGHRDVRFSMRAKIGRGKEPLLHTTYETLQKLLAERGEIK